MKAIEVVRLYDITAYQARLTQLARLNFRVAAAGYSYLQNTNEEIYWAVLQEEDQA